MRLTWILGAVLVLVVAATIWISTAGRERQWQQERARVEVEGVIANLNPPPEVIYSGSSLSALNRLRQCRYELSGTTRSAEEYDSGETRGLSQAEQACDTVREWFLPERQKMPVAQYIQSRRSIYNNQSRPRLQELSKSCRGDLAMGALRAMLSAGDDPAPLIARAEELYLTDWRAKDSAAIFLGQLRCPLPVAPSDPSALPAYVGQQRAGGGATTLPAGAAFRLDDPRLRHDGKVTAISFSADSSKLISGSENGEVVIWAVDTAQSLRRMCFPGGIRGLLLLPDGSTVVLAQLLFIWPAGQNAKQTALSPMVQGYRGTEPQTYDWIELSPDGKTVGAAYRDKSALTCDLFDLQSNRITSHSLRPQWLVRNGSTERKFPNEQFVPPLRRQVGSPWSLSPDGRLLAVPQQNRIGLFDMRTRKRIFATDLFESPPEVVGRVDDRLYIRADGRLRVFQLPLGEANDAMPRELPSPVPADESVWSASISPSAHKLALVTGKASSRATSRPSDPLPILSILDLRDGRRMEITGQAGNKTGRLELDPFPGHNNLLVAGWLDNSVSIYDSQSGQLRYHFASYSRHFGFLGRPDIQMNLVAAGSEHDGLVLYSTRCGMVPQSINRLFWDGSKLAVSPGQKCLAVTQGDSRHQSVCIWEADAVKLFLGGPESGHPGPVKRLDLSGQAVTALAWLDEGDCMSRFLVTAQSGRTDLVIWDVRTGKPVTRLVGHYAPVTSMHCDGQGLLYSVSSDTALIAWNVKELLKWCLGKTGK